MRFQRENNIKYWAEMSAKSGEHIESLFLDASKFLYRQLENTETTSQGSMTEYNDQRSSNGSMVSEQRPQNVASAAQGQRPNYDDDNIVLKPEEMDFPITNKKSSCKC